MSCEAGSGPRPSEEIPDVNESEELKIEEFQTFTFIQEQFGEFNSYTVHDSS